MSDGGHVGAAKRRRDRQLRAFHRHEQFTVRMELATALHHSAQCQKSRVVEGPSEGVEHEKYGLRAQKPPLPGKHHGRYAPEGQLWFRCFTVTMLLALRSLFLIVRAKMLGIMVGLTVALRSTEKLGITGK